MFKIFLEIDIMARCQKEILEVYNRPICGDEDLVAILRYWEICEIITKYNEEVEKIE